MTHAPPVRDRTASYPPQAIGVVRPRLRWLPYGALWIAVLILKVIAIFHFRADSDETQHAHVVWGWATGHLQYRDIFDNHMPLFQILCAPLFSLLGERADMLIWLRFAMLPLYALGLWSVFRLTAVLFNTRTAAWTMLFAAAWHQYFYTSTEFRADDLWAAVWLVGLMVSLSGEFTVRRAFYSGLLLGIAFAISLKSVVLVLALACAAAISLALGMLDGQPLSLRAALRRLMALLGASLIVPAAIVAYFASRGALGIMVYCVVQHNMVAGLRHWGSFWLLRWLFPAAIPVLAGYAWVIRRQCSDKAVAVRRTVVILTPLLYVAALISYWPEVTREDALPYAPLIPLVALPLLLWLRSIPLFGKLEPAFLRWGLPLIAVLELFGIWHANNLRQNRLGVTNHSIEDVLMLTRPGEYVMDNKGDYIYRPRPCYWVFEPMTDVRISRGLIKLDIPKRLEDTGTKICYFWSARRSSPDVTRFITRNYLPFDPKAGDLGVAGKIISSAPGSNVFNFTVSIPVTYSLISDNGATRGYLDGKPYLGPLAMAAGPHQFVRIEGSGKAAIMLSDAVQKGFRPLFARAEQLIDDTSAR